MSYPFIGITGILPEGEEWDAAHVERLLRDGQHIYLETDIALKNDIWSVLFADGVFRVVDSEDKAGYETPSFLELAVWLAFYGRDFF